MGSLHILSCGISSTTKKHSAIEGLETLLDLLSADSDEREKEFEEDNSVLFLRSNLNCFTCGVSSISSAPFFRISSVSNIFALCFGSRRLRLCFECLANSPENKSPELSLFFFDIFFLLSFYYLVVLSVCACARV